MQTASCSRKCLLSSRQTKADVLRATKEFAKESRARSWWHLVSTAFVLALAMAAAIMAPHWGLQLAASYLVGLTTVRFFILFHDQQHGTIFRGSPTATAIFTFFGLATLNPPSAWKRSHDHHHVHNAKNFEQSIGTFPVMTTERFRLASRWERALYGISRHPLTLLAGYVTVFLYSMTIKPLFTKPKRHWDCGVALLLHIVAVVALAIFAPGALVFAFLLPLIIASALGSYLFYSQHNYPGVKLNTPPKWDHVSAAICSSSYTKMGPVLGWFTGNIGYHHVHHLNARIPFYRLPEAMSKISHLGSLRPIYLSVRDIRRCLSLKLWDEKRKRMVTYAAAARYSH